METVRLMHCVDKPSNLRHIVQAELKSQHGIKVPKQKKAKKLNLSRNSSQEGLTAGIFGNYLSFVPSKYVTDCGFVPNFLVEAAEMIKENSLMEGIFRKTGSINRQKEMKLQVEEGQILDSGNVHDVAALVKQFFRELPEPLFTSLFHDTFVRCFCLELDNKMDALLKLCLLLPMEHLSTLRFTMGLLAHLASCSEHNKMDAANLAAMLAPNIMHCNSRSQKMNSTEEKLLYSQTAIVELLIRNAEQIGVVSDSLYERTIMMGETWGTEDELEASDDNTLDDSKDVKETKKKRRKRSSSLQGLVSSIGRGLSKLRRNSEGKNTSSTVSSYSLTCDSDATLATTQPLTSKSMSSALPLSKNDTNLPLATPVVMRKRKMSGSGDVMPFSATKRKAILDTLPHKSALAHTPFTPASAKKAMMELNLGTPCLLHGTPKPDMSTNKSMRKKLNLFSPGSSISAKRSKSTASSNLCSSGLRRSAKAKHIFKRMSGGKEKEAGDREMDPFCEGKSGSPDSSGPPSHLAVELLPVHASHQSLIRTVSSPSMLETSSGDLDKGFIDADMTAAVLDATAAERSALASSPSLKGQGDPLYIRKMPVCRSLSTDASLRRGQPNKLCNGLLEGKTENVKKLRRSFDKSDIGPPIPYIVPPLPEKPQDRDELERWCGESARVVSENDRMESNCFERSSLAEEHSIVDVETSLLQVVLPPPSGFGDQSIMAVDTKGATPDGHCSDNESEAGFSTISGGTVIHNPVPAARLQNFGQRSSSSHKSIASYGSSVSVSIPTPGMAVDTEYATPDGHCSDNESEAGFSTISGGTVIHNPVPAARLESLSQRSSSSHKSITSYGSSVSVSIPTPGILQSSSSIDSLFSTASETSQASCGSGKAKSTMDRTFSVDSGKGSLVDIGEPILSGFFRAQSKQIAPAPHPDPDFCSLASDESEDINALVTAPVRAVKSRSAEDLKSRPLAERPAVRSHSMYVISGSRNKAPNLHISAETHRLLTRAGFLESSLPPNVKDATLSVRASSPQKGETSHSHSFFNREEHLSRCSFRRGLSSSFPTAARRDKAQSFSEQRCSPVKEEVPLETSFKAEEIFHASVADKDTKTDETALEEEIVWVRQKSLEDTHSFAVPADPSCSHISKGCETASTSISLKRAEMRLQKHDSVTHIKKSNLGKVAENVRQINISLDGCTIDRTSLHMSSFVQGQRGVSPVRIPTIFATSKGSASSADYYRQLAQKALKRNGDETKEVEAVGEPKIRSGDSHSAHAQRRHHHLCLAGHSGQSENTLGQSEIRGSVCENELLSLGPESANVCLSSSLMETIEDVLTPSHHRRRSQQHQHKEEKPTSPLRESTNTKCDLPPRTQGSRSSALHSLTESIQLRTSKGLTPHQVLRHGPVAPASPRSPGKIVKRLQSAQRSPLSPRSSQKARDNSRFSIKSQDFSEHY